MRTGRVPPALGAGLVSPIPRLAGGNVNRLTVYQFILDHPGLNLQELADAVGIHRTAVVYHVRRMMKESLVVTQRQGPHVLHFPSEMPATRRAALSALRIASVRAVVLELHQHPELSGPRLAAKLGTTVRTVRRAVRFLSGRGLLVVEQDRTAGRGRAAHLHPELRLLLARWEPDEPLGKG